VFDIYVFIYDDAIVACFTSACLQQFYGNNSGAKEFLNIKSF
jgi:hypothetical protein